MNLCIYLLPFIAWFLHPASSQDESTTSAQSFWTVPPGDQDDFTVTLQNKQTVPVSWEGWDTPWYETYLNGKRSNDLWVTSYDYRKAPFSQLLAVTLPSEAIDVSKAGAYTWHIDIPDTSLSKTAKYVLRFKNPASPRDSYNHEDEQLSSPGFIVVNGLSTSEPIRTSTSLPISSPTSSATSSATPAPSDPADSPSDLSTGAKAGIGVGATVGGIAVLGFVVAALIWRRRVRRKAAFSEVDDPGPEYELPKPENELHEVPGAPVVVEPAELPGNRDTH